MKLYLLSIITCTSLLAFTAEVKKDSVKLQINDTVQIYESGEKFTLKSADIICFIDGKGRVVIEGINYKKQLSKRSRSCKQIPILKDNTQSLSYLAVAEKSVLIFFADAKEDEVAGVSRKSTTQENVTQKIILISEDKKFIAIKNSQWGPLPIQLDIYDTEGLVVDTFENEEDIMTSFILPVTYVKEGYKLKVTNAFGDTLVDVLIQIKKEKNVK